jgi:hypothetical protein
MTTTQTRPQSKSQESRKKKRKKKKRTKKRCNPIAERSTTLNSLFDQCDAVQKASTPFAQGQRRMKKKEKKIPFGPIHKHV